MTDAARLADDLGVSPGDVEVVAGWLGCPSGAWPGWAAAEVRGVLDPDGERTGLSIPGDEPTQITKGQE